MEINKYFFEPQFLSLPDYHLSYCVLRYQHLEIGPRILSLKHLAHQWFDAILLHGFHPFPPTFVENCPTAFDSLGLEQNRSDHMVTEASSFRPAIYVAGLGMKRNEREQLRISQISESLEQ